MRRLGILLLIPLLSNLSCKDDSGKNDLVALNCPKIEIPSTVEEFDEIVVLSYIPIDIDKNQTALFLNFGVSGCDLNRTFTLTVSPAIDKSLPPQRFAKISFEPQICQAFFTPNLCYDRANIPDETILKFITPSDTFNLTLPAL